MKRSTIILIIYIILSIITPVILLKSCVGNSPKEQVEMWHASIRRNADASVRYLFIPEGVNDSVKLDIHIRAEERTGDTCRTFVNGVAYEKDTLCIAANSQGEIEITYEADGFALIIENNNSRATFHIDEAVIDELMVSSRGDIYVNSSNVGMMLVTDSIGVGMVHIDDSNVGTLMSSRDGAQNLTVESSNVGRISIPIGSVCYEIEDSNIGMMVNGGKRELIIGGSNAHMKVDVNVDVDSSDEEDE